MPDWRMADLHLAQDEPADRLLIKEPLALLLGMLLDQDMREGCTAN